MRYLRMPLREEYEAEALPRFFDKSYAPVGDVSLSRAVGLSDPGVDFVPLDGQTLAIEPETASWTFLTSREAEFLAAADGRSFGWVQDNWPADAAAPPEGLVAHLYRRGLLRLNGLQAVDPTVFRDSPNNFDGHLVELLLTEKCNLACGYCLAGTSPNMPAMTEEIALRTVDLAFGMREAPAFTFEFAGGEPFMKYRLMQQVVEHIHEHMRRDGRPVHLAVQTNATLLTEERVRWLKEHDVSVGVSLDGNPRSHNRSRPQLNGRESFSRVMRGLELLRQYEVPFGILVVLNRFNAESAQELLDFLGENQIAALKLNPIAFIGTARTTWDQFGLDQAEVLAYFQSFARLIVEQRRMVLEDNLRTMIEYLMSKQRSSRCMRTHCGAGETFQTINARGEIFPCGRSTQSPALAIGNVATELVSLSAPGRTNRFVQEIRHRRPGALEGCSSCSYRQLCQAGCSVQAFERYGTVRHRTPECDFYKAMYPYLMRWLAFDASALAHLNQAGYFSGGVELVGFDYLPEGAAVPPALVAPVGT